ncbi:MAG: hypothetical protein V1798_05130 [Pseudomonadota bacterium]
MRSRIRSFPLLLGFETLLLTAFGLIVSRSPLFRSLAYEFSTLLGGFAALTLAIGIGVRLREIRNRRPFETADFIGAATASLLALIIPLAALLVSGGAKGTCRFDVGIAWFLLETVPSALFGAACAIWANERPASMGKVILRSLLPAILFTALTLWDLWSAPPLYFLHPAFGYFAGPLYDEWIPLDTRILTFRFWTLLLSAWLASATLLSSRNRPSQHSRIWILSGLLIALPLFFRGPLGWVHSAKEIQAELGASLRTPNVVLFYDPAGLAPADAKRLVGTLEYRVRELARRLDVSLSDRTPVEVYLYPNAEKKRRLTGTRYTEIGNPWQRRLHLLDLDPSSPALTHELAHVVTAPLGVPLLGLPLRAGLLEGLATAMEGYRDNFSVHEWAAGMRKLSLLPDLALSMQTFGFLTESPVRAYLAAGSFCLWLLDTSGPVPFAQVYGGASFRDVYGSDFGVLASRWRAFLARIPVSRSQLLLMQSQLMHRPIFERRCPHDVADERERAGRCMEKDDTAGAVNHLTKAWKWSAEAPNFALRLALLELRRGEIPAAEAFLAGVFASTGSTPEELAWANVLSGDAAMLKGMEPEARGRWLFLGTNAPLHERLAATSRLNLDSSHQNQLLIRLLKAGATRAWISDLTESPSYDPNQPALWLFAAEASWRQRRPAIALKFLGAVREQADLELESRRLLLHATVSEELGNTDKAIRDYQSLFLHAASAGLRLRAVDQINRLLATK